MIGYTIDLSDPTGLVHIALEMEAKHTNRIGTLHGGIHAMMLDAAAGFAASRYLAGDADLVPVVTLTLNTSFIGVVAQGKVLVTGRYSGGGHKIVYADAELHDADGRLCSKATGVFKRLSK